VAKHRFTLIAFRKAHAAPKALLVFALLLCAAGCSRLHFHHHSSDTVYVSARQSYLHDRVAAVSNRVAGVVNGQALQVLDRNRRFLKVKTDKNQTGWIEERSVIDAKTYAAFQQLADQHKNDVVTAQATLRDDLYMHLTPGRTAEHFYLIPGNAKVQLLSRATVQRTSSNAVAPAPKPVAPPAQSGKDAAVPQAPEAPAPPPMEDWWLVRDGQGHTGWLLAGRLDVDVPDAVGLYAEGQHIIGAWPLAQVTDTDDNGVSHPITEYLMALAQPKAGLPYDFDQIRVFTWNVKRHRYETAYRLRDIRGYLPMHVTERGTGGAPASFQFLIAGNDKAMADPVTGAPRPAVPRMLSYQLLDTRVVRTGPDMGQIPTFGDSANKDKKNAKDAKKKHK